MSLHHFHALFFSLNNLQENSLPANMSTAADRHLPPHVALFPSAGMGHLTPFLRLAAMLTSFDCHVTLIAAQTTVSAAESAHITGFLAAYPTVNRVDFEILPYTPPATADPFFVQFEAINRSAHLLAPLLSSSSPPVSAIFSDYATAPGICQVAEDINIPNYIVTTTSARFFSLMAYIPTLIPSGSSISMAETEASVQIPGLAPFQISTLPPPLFIPNHIFTNTLISNSKLLSKAKGILSNTFHTFEPETISALNGGNVIPDFPPFLPIGPIKPCKIELGDHQPLPWLDQQPPESVVYINFGSRTAMPRDQITELQNALDRSGQRFLWVLKTSTVDKDDGGELKELLGDLFLQKTKQIGMVVKGWVNQEEILSHPAIGGFVSHCGWNSVMEAAARGIPVLAWPQHGDQKVNAGVLEKAGLGIWEKGWGWSGEKLVKAEEIAEKVKMVMCDENLRASARKIGEEARTAIKAAGSSHKMLMDIIQNPEVK